MWTIKKNPDAEFLKQVEEAINIRNGYCCCELEDTPDTKCMCKEFREQEESGFCHCGRFYKIKQQLNVVLIGSIKPENYALFTKWFDILTAGDYIVHPILLHPENPYTDAQNLETYKSAIAQAAAVICIPNVGLQNNSFVEIFKDWAESLQIPFTTTEELK